MTSSRLRSRVSSAVSSSICLLDGRDLRRCTARAPSAAPPARPSAFSTSRFSSSSALLQLGDRLALLLGARLRRRRATPRSRSGPGRRSPSRTDSRVVARNSRLSASFDLAPAARRPSAGSPRRSSAAACSCAWSCCSLLRSTPRLACCSCACVTSYSSCANRRCVFFQSRS